MTQSMARPASRAPLPLRLQHKGRIAFPLQTNDPVMSADFLDSRLLGMVSAVAKSDRTAQVIGIKRIVV